MKIVIKEFIMRRYLAAATLTICASLAFAKSASAGYDGPYVCWTSTGGWSRCVGLATNYNLQGVRRPAEPYGTVSFTLTRHLIDGVLPRYVSTDGMYPGQKAIIYTPGYGSYASGF
jgi:hypothetical protein